MSIQKAGTLKIFSHYIIKDFLDPAILAGAPDEAKAEANSDEKGMCLTIILYGLTIKHIRGCPYIASAAITRQGQSES